MIILTATLIFLSPTAVARESTSGAVRAFPEALMSFPDREPFNALHIGPGNTFYTSKIPPDYELNDFEFSPDGQWIALGWKSGRIEITDIRTKKKVSEFKADLGEPYLLRFNPPGKEIVVSGSDGRISFFALPSGERTRRLKVPLGKRKYGIQSLVLDQQGKWLAYATGENAKVLDLSTEPPSPIADLDDASTLSLSQDGRELWSANRESLRWRDTSNWQGAGPSPLKSPPINTSPVVIQSADAAGGELWAAVPSKTGLVVYRGREMSGQLITDKATTRVVFSRSGGFLELIS